MRTRYLRCSRCVIGLSIAVLAIALSGCQRGHYDLELSADEATLHRELRYQVARGENEPPSPVEADEARILAMAYGMPAPNPLPMELVLNGEFAGATPADIGGAGSLEHWKTPLGAAWSYVERFRGNDAPQATLAEREVATDEVVDLIRDWFEVELQSSADRERVDAFLDTDFRNDMRSLATLIWTAGASNAVHPENADGNHEYVVRAGLYLVEHGYLTARDLPRLGLLDQEQEQFEFTRSMLWQRLYLDLSQPEWRFLTNRRTAEGSLNAAIGTRPLPQPDGTQVPVPASTWVGDRVLCALGGPLDGGDGLAVRLRLPGAPYHTNGQWQADEGCVFWQRGLPLRAARTSPALPAMLYAQWSKPDAAFQTAHFGKVVLADEPLWEYCDWSASLNDEQRRAWEDFVATLKPGPNLVQQVQGFAFPASNGNIEPPVVLIDALNAR